MSKRGAHYALGLGAPPLVLPMLVWLNEVVGDVVPYPLFKGVKPFAVACRPKPTHGGLGKVLILGPKILRHLYVRDVHGRVHRLKYGLEEIVP